MVKRKLIETSAKEEAELETEPWNLLTQNFMSYYAELLQLLLYLVL